MGNIFTKFHYHQNLLVIDTDPPKHVFRKCANKKCTHLLKKIPNSKNNIVRECRTNCNCHNNLFEDL